MKKTILTSMIAVAISGAAFAQGTVNWSSISFANFTAQTNSTLQSAIFGNGSSTGNGAIGNTAGAATTGFFYELLYKTQTAFGVAASQPTTLAALQTWSDVGLGATNSNTAGRVTVTGGGAAAVIPWANGVTNNIMMVGWSANLGTTWAAALANLQNSSYLTALTAPGYFGTSVVGYISPSTSTTSGNPAFGASAQAYGVPIQSLNTQLYIVGVTATPEPGTMALAALGGASLLLFRRRK